MSTNAVRIAETTPTVGRKPNGKPNGKLNGKLNCQHCLERHLMAA